MAVSQAPVSSMTRVARSKFITLGSFEVRNPSHFPATLLKSVTAVGCHWRVSQGAMELQATMSCKKAKPKHPAIFFIYILIMLVSFRRFNFFRNSDQVHRRVLVKASTYLLAAVH